MELNVKLELKDYEKFSFDYYRKKIFSKLFKIAGVIVAIFLVLFMLYSSPENNSSAIVEETNRNTPFPINIIIFLFIVIAVPLFSFFSIKKQLRKHFESNVLLQDEHKYVFTEEYFEVSSVNGSSKILWDKVNRVEFLKNSYAIFISNMQAYVIPKRCIDGIIDKDEFERILSNKGKKK